MQLVIKLLAWCVFTMMYEIGSNQDKFFSNEAHF